MRTVISLTLLGAGLFMAMHLLFPDPRSSQDDLIAATEAQAPIGYRVVRAPDSGQARSFSPSTPLFSSGSEVPAPIIARPEPAPAPPSASTESATVAPVTARRVLTPAPVLVRPASSSRPVLNATGSIDPPRPRMASTEPADPSARYALIRDLQRELKRAGCYYGKIDGSWGPGSKYALGRFNRIVNSALDAQAPDYIQLALVRAHADGVCNRPQHGTIVAGAGAGSGGGLTPPLPVPLAKLDKTPRHAQASPGQVRRAAARDVVASDKRTNRVAVTGPDTQRLTTASTRIGAWTTRVSEPPKLVRNPTLVQRETTPPQPQPRQLAAPVRRSPVLQGRMALAGPRSDEGPAIIRKEAITRSTAEPQVYSSSEAGPSPKNRTTRSVEQRKPTQAAPRHNDQAQRAQKRAQKRAKKRYSKQARQRRLMREAFGDTMF